MVKKFPNLNFKTKKVGFIILIALLIVNIAIILTLFDGNNGIESENVTFTITDVDCVHTNEYYEYTLSANIILDQYPSNLKGYYLKQTFYNQHDCVICDKTYKLDSLVTQNLLNDSIPLKIKVYKQPYPHHVSIEIIKDGKVINNNTYKFNQYQMRGG